MLTLKKKERVFYSKREWDYFSLKDDNEIIFFLSRKDIFIYYYFIDYFIYVRISALCYVPKGLLLKYFCRNNVSQTYSKWKCCGAIMLWNTEIKKWILTRKVISKSLLNTLLYLHMIPIKRLVLPQPMSTHLEDGFPLRCFQRLSQPTIATRRCSWRNNRDTSGSSDSVLSY